MATHFAQFDTTVGSLMTDLTTQILSSSDWANITPVAVTATTTANTGTSVTAFTVGSTTGMYIGMNVRITVSGTDYYRHITALTGTTITLSDQLGVATTTGQTITSADVVFRATTTRGAQMAFAIQAIGLGSGASRTALGFQFFQTHTGANTTSYTNPSGKRFLRFQSASAVAGTDPLHVTLSLGKEHFFLQIEGPRSNEANTDNSTVGSLKNVAFMSDLVPYHAEDTMPVVVAYAPNTTSTGGPAQETVTFVEVSRNYANTNSWVQARLGTIAAPSNGSSATWKVNRSSTISGKEYLWPYVVSQVDEGLRGRLAKIFYAGSNAYNQTGDVSEPVGDEVTYDGNTYRLVTAVKHNTTSSSYWYSPFGLIYGSSADVYNAPVVAIPVA